MSDKKTTAKSSTTFLVTKKHGPLNGSMNGKRTTMFYYHVTLKDGQACNLQGIGEYEEGKSYCSDTLEQIASEDHHAGFYLKDPVGIAYPLEKEITVKVFNTSPCTKIPGRNDIRGIITFPPHLDGKSVKVQTFQNSKKGQGMVFTNIGLNTKDFGMVVGLDPRPEDECKGTRAYNQRLWDSIQEIGKAGGGSAAKPPTPSF